MSNSKLICYTKLSPNCNKPRNHKIDTITIHHMAGNLTIEQCGNVFAPTSRQASSNYGIGSDGRIGMYVEEANRSWCSSSPSNDHRAITIEVANDGGEPNWHVSDKAMASLINLCVDICKRNGIKILNYTGDTSGNLTMHKWFAATGCPGPYLSSKFPYIASEVNKRLGSSTATQQDNKKTTTKTTYLTYAQFEKKYKGKAVDYDGVAGVQCVDLVDQYLKDCFGITGVWVNGAKDLYNNFATYPALVKNFTRVSNTRELVVAKGDIVVWGGGTWGHTGIGNGEGNIDYFVSLEENTLGKHEKAQLVKHYFNGKGGNDGCNPVLGVLRPKDQKRIQGGSSSSTSGSYMVKITTDALNIRSGAGVSNKIVGCIRDKGVYTITAEKTVSGQVWGKLKSGAGWICLTGFTKKV